MGYESWDRESFLGSFSSREVVMILQDTLSLWMKVDITLLQIKNHRTNALDHLEVRRPESKSRVLDRLRADGMIVATTIFHLSAQDIHQEGVISLYLD